MPRVTWLLVLDAGSSVFSNVTMVTSQIRTAMLVFERLPPIKAPRSGVKMYSLCEEQSYHDQELECSANPAHRMGEERRGMLTKITHCAPDHLELSKKQTCGASFQKLNA